MAKILFVVANVGFQDEEFSIPFELLSSQGHFCDVASWKGGKCRGVFFKTIEKSLKFEDVQVSDYVIVVFVGWGGAYEDVTGWDDGFWTQIAYLQHNGAIFKEEEVVQDGNLITANGPAAAAKFAWAIVDFLKNSWTGIYSSWEYHEW